MAKQVEISNRTLSQFNSLEFTGYRYEIIGRKPESLREKRLKLYQEKEFNIQERLSGMKRQLFSDLNANAVLKCDDKRMSNREEKILKVATMDQNRLQKTLNESRREALRKLFCDDYNAYELELQSLGKSIYKHYK